jgi:V8-like Glu-specific endopeptidase
VYGVDNRTDVYAHDNATMRLRAEQSTVALMRPHAINTSNPDNITFNGGTLQQRENLCTGQRFLDDPAPARCSGTLIGGDLVLTAGHCIEDAADCANTRFVFRFYRASASTLATITTDDIFSCSQIVVRRAPPANESGLDYAIVRLDRTATPRFVPAPVRRGNTALPTGQGLAVIGSGSGVPFKIDSGGSVRDARTAELDFFVANTDTFGGNSGSGVYESTNNTVAGILVRGATDYVFNGNCRVVNTCSEAGCSGESITYVHNAINHYCATEQNPRLCGFDPAQIVHASFPP